MRGGILPHTFCQEAPYVFSLILKFIFKFSSVQHFFVLNDFEIRNLLAAQASDCNGRDGVFAPADV